MKITNCNYEQVASLWLDSPQATAFTHPLFLEELKVKVTWIGAFKGEELFCAWPVVEDGEFHVQVPFLYYLGPLWSSRRWFRPISSRFAETQKVYQLFVEYLLETFGYVSAQLHPSLNDVRAFDWWNYGSESGRFLISPRYSAVIGNLQHRSMDEIFQGFRSVRRQEYRYMQKEAYAVFHNHSSQVDFLDLYGDMYSRKGIHVDLESQGLLERILNSSALGRVHTTSVCKSDGSGELLGASVVVDAKGVSNLIMKATSAEAPLGTSALLIKSSIEEAQSRGSEVFDFNGANSPHRGDDKHSYGAIELLYFEIGLSLNGG